MLVENIKTEQDVFTALGLKYIEPQDQNLTVPTSGTGRKKRLKLHIINNGHYLCILHPIMNYSYQPLETEVNGF